MSAHRKHPHNEHHKSDNGDNFYKGLLAGVVIGGAFLWLFTTEKGKRIRKELQNENTQWLDIVRDFLEEHEILEKKKTSKVEVPSVQPVAEPIQNIPAVMSQIPESLVVATQAAAAKKFFRRKKPLFRPS